MFAARYQQSRSLAASSFEHALYGCFLFTVGLGQFFLRRNHRHGGHGVAVRELSEDICPLKQKGPVGFG